MYEACLIVEDEPRRAEFLRKKLRGAAAAWLICDSSTAVDSLRASPVDCVAIDIAQLRVPFAPFWKELERAAGESRGLGLILTGTRGSKIAGFQDIWDESIGSFQILDFAGLRRQLRVPQLAKPRESRRGVPRWKRHGLDVLKTGIGAETNEVSRADWLRYAGEFVRNQGEGFYFRALLMKLRQDLAWLSTVHPPEGISASPPEPINPLGTGAGPFPAHFGAEAWLEAIHQRIQTDGVTSTLDQMALVIQRSLTPWKQFRKWCKEGHAYQVVCSCRDIWVAGTAPDLTRPEAVFARLPNSAELKRARRVLKSLGGIGMRFEAGPGYIESWTTLSRESITSALPARDRPFVFFLRLGENPGDYLWPQENRVTQNTRQIPVDRPLAVEDIEISRLENRGKNREEEFYFEIPYPMKMRSSRNGIEIQLMVEEILHDEDLLRSEGMSGREDAAANKELVFLAARTWAFEGGFMLVPVVGEVGVEPQLRTYEKEMSSRYVYSRGAAERLRFLGVALFNRLLAAKRMKRLRY